MTDPPYYDIGQMVVYRSNQFLALNKPAGLPVQSNSMIDLNQMANAYAQQKLFVLHRIDQPVSGLVLFARRKNSAGKMSEAFKKGEIDREYLAVVSERPKEDKGELKAYLTIQSRSNKTLIAQDDQGKASNLVYKYLCSSEHYHLLSIRLKTGRRHQIRAMLAEFISPIKGDVKYGARRSNKTRMIHLHAFRLSFKHPISGATLDIRAPLPDADPLWNHFSTCLTDFYIDPRSAR